MNPIFPPDNSPSGAVGLFFVITNTATSTFETLSNPDFDFETNFSLFPNPAADEMQIISKGTTTIKSVAIYSLLGQVLKIQPNFTGKINVSNLAPGT